MLISNRNYLGRRKIALSAISNACHNYMMLARPMYIHGFLGRRNVKIYTLPAYDVLYLSIYNLDRSSVVHKLKLDCEWGNDGIGRE